MFLEMKKSIEEKIRDKFGDVSFEIREAPENFGDFSLDIAFRLAKKLKKNPNEIGIEVAEILKTLEFIKNVEVVNGYVNFNLKRSYVLENLLKSELSFENRKEKVILEHTSVNPNKAMHVGHLRNVCIGDSLYRFLKFIGYDVEVQNYIDDTGNQVAATLIGFFGIDDIERKIKDKEFLEKMKKKIEEISQKEKLDLYCWDLYSSVYEKYDEKELENTIKIVMREIENKGLLFEFVKWFGEMIVKNHLETVEILNIHYDLLTRESDILSLGFWEESFDLMKKSKKFVYETEGTNKDCWVIKMDEIEEFSNMKNPDKIIVKSDGTVTYTGKDLAYHFWKFGILDRDFHYRIFDEKKGIWITEDEETGEEPEFGKGDIVINVIDIRQEYPQKVLKYSLKSLGYEKESENLIHYGYEVVALSQKSMEELGKENKRYLHMSGRKGIGVKADDLIKTMKDVIKKEVEKKDFDENEKKDIVDKLVAGAIRYYMVKQNRNKVLVFDIEDATRTEGNSGIYIQYSLVRCKNILKQKSEYEIGDLEDKEWKLVKKLIIWDEVIKKAETNDFDLSVISDYVYELAKHFNEFYHENQVIGSDREKVRIAILKSFEKIYSKLIWILGIPEVEKM